MINSNTLTGIWDMITINFHFENNSQEQSEACEWTMDMKCHQVISH